MTWNSSATRIRGTVGHGAARRSCVDSRSSVLPREDHHHRLSLGLGCLGEVAKVASKANTQSVSRYTDTLVDSGRQADKDGRTP